MAPSVETTPIPGLLVVRLDRHDDDRGFFKENWQRAKMVAAGLPDFGPVQNNVSFNIDRGVTRGFHTEPWDKLVSLATGRIFGAWVDMREGPTHGATFTLEMDTAVAVFVPRGVGNSYQTLTDGTAYTYLVNAHWREGIRYPAAFLGDPAIGVDWPVPLQQSVLSEKDQHLPLLADTTPVPPPTVLVLGAGGQVGQALLAALPGAVGVTRAELDLTDHDALAAWPWHDYATVINAGAWTAVDAAETTEGRAGAWAANATGPAQLARLAVEHGFTLVHYSSEYVFDVPHDVGRGHVEGDPLAPLGVYGASKAAGDLAVQVAPRHYLLRTSWVIGQGRNFVATMADLAARGVDPAVVDDQVGCPTFADELARATLHLLDSDAPYGTYHVTGSGPAVSWHEVARAVFAGVGADPGRVSATSTAAYGEGKDLAPRPAVSTMSLAKLEATGFTPRDWRDSLAEHLGSHPVR